MNIVSIIISVLALLLAAYSLYIQRKDRKPKLNLEVTQADQRRSFSGDQVGGQIVQTVPCVILRLSNPTDKTIKVRKVLLTSRKHQSVTLIERTYPDIEVASHSDNRLDWTAMQINYQTEAAGWTDREAAFEVHDAIGNVFESEFFVFPVHPDEASGV